MTRKTFLRNELSPRVLAAVARTEEQSETLITLVQLGFLLFMGTLYFLAPKGYTGDVPIRPVPLVLLVYLPLVMVRLLLAWRRLLTPLLLGFSILVDMVMLSLLIWAFHLQYRQPPGFYLNSPEVMFIYIFIALRALRFDPRYVIGAGVAAAAGWLFLTVYAIRAGSGITRDYAEYLTGSSVLVGAQVAQIIAILTLSAILALAVYRSGSILIRAAREESLRQDLTRYFSPLVVERIVAADGGIRPGDGEFHLGTVMMIDLRGFSARAAAMDPKEVMTMLAEFQGRVVPLVMEQGGSIDKFMGDGILAHFGTATRSDRHAHEALTAAEAIRESLLEWRDDIAFGIGIASGEVIFGAVGDETRLEFTVIGPPVNTAAKLEKFSKRLRAHIVATRQTWNRARRFGFKPRASWRSVRRAPVEGLSDPLDLVAVLR
ncbi:MAG: adenylate/guanylate cyclase domain-containing protein [Spirochaetaceae bacterium]|nr:MAG: adenylate/guanylate cyclase domain-containing protein [Spirochaetaceae bacterium]